ncbi:MAG: peptide-methionine (S)-S-oxide reductase [Salinimicrobium sp.]
MTKLKKIGLGGGCHWCTEAVFQAVPGVERVEQGYIASEGAASSFSEAVIIHYPSKKAFLEQLIRIHLHTHSSTSAHSFRGKYRSAIYTFSAEDAAEAEAVLHKLKQESSEEIITQVLPFRSFKASREEIQNYYKKHPKAPFCKRYIEPKLVDLRSRFKI